MKKGLVDVASHPLHDPTIWRSAKLVFEPQPISVLAHILGTIRNPRKIDSALGFGTVSYSNARPSIFGLQSDSRKLAVIPL
jgi:hypothetical protein